MTRFPSPTPRHAAPAPGAEGRAHRPAQLAPRRPEPRAESGGVGAPHAVVAAADVRQLRDRGRNRDVRDRPDDGHVGRADREDLWHLLPDAWSAAGLPWKRSIRPAPNRLGTDWAQRGSDLSGAASAPSLRRRRSPGPPPSPSHRDPPLGAKAFVVADVRPEEVEPAIRLALLSGVQIRADQMDVALELTGGVPCHGHV
jgi:hypothetical protein